MTTMPAASQVETPSQIRRLLLGLVVLGVLAIGTDLLLLEHYENSWMLVPLFLIAVALAVVLWHVVDSGPASVRALQVTMATFVLVGLLGVFLHYRANLEFQLDMDATQSSWELFKKVMRAKAPPALAPAAMTQLGLLGLLYAFRHPALAERRKLPANDIGSVT
jgi:hypothetical protein